MEQPGEIHAVQDDCAGTPLFSTSRVFAPARRLNRRAQARGAAAHHKHVVRRIRRFELQRRARRLANTRPGGCAARGHRSERGRQRRARHAVFDETASRPGPRRAFWFRHHRPPRCCGINRRRHSPETGLLRTAAPQRTRRRGMTSGSIAAARRRTSSTRRRLELRPDSRPGHRRVGIRDQPVGVTRSVNGS